MITSAELDSLIERLKSDASDYKNENPGSHGLYEYLKELVETENLIHPAAIGAAKVAIDKDISALSEAQLKALGLDIIKNDMYMSECPNDGNIIVWSDMSTALYEGHCSDCEYREQKIMNE
ncbi:hypothetical protein ACQKGB_21490 [Bacillus tropicus]|uniref:hypothetical protein n=1 Tax=Bacillus tropicus TaxID=2026188 RepID=UPI003D0071F9